MPSLKHALKWSYVGNIITYLFCCFALELANTEHSALLKFALIFAESDLLIGYTNKRNPLNLNTNTLANKALRLRLFPIAIEY